MSPGGRIGLGQIGLGRGGALSQVGQEVKDQAEVLGSVLEAEVIEWSRGLSLLKIINVFGNFRTDLNQVVDDGGARQAGLADLIVNDVVEQGQRVEVAADVVAVDAGFWVELARAETQHAGESDGGLDG